MSAASSVTRRDLFRLLGGVAASAIALSYGCGDNLLGSAEAAGDTQFDGDQLAMLRGFADVVIPVDDQPGGADLGAVEFIEGLITAFDTGGAPRIFAGGPFSDRNPNADGSIPDNAFEEFVALDRVKATAWRLIVDGSPGVSGGAPNEALLGPVIGLRAQLVTGLEAAIAMAPGPIADLTPAQFQNLFNSQPADFQALVIDLVIEGCFAAPEYGGNPDLAGWNMVHFEGDSLPRGYSAWTGTAYVERPEAPLWSPNPSDPEPLTDDLKQTLALVIAVLGGRST
jgi:hypothetical protein